MKKETIWKGVWERGRDREWDREQERDREGERWRDREWDRERERDREGEKGSMREVRKVNRFWVLACFRRSLLDLWSKCLIFSCLCSWLLKHSLFPYLSFCLSICLSLSLSLPVYTPLFLLFSLLRPSLLVFPPLLHLLFAGHSDCAAFGYVFLVAGIAWKISRNGKICKAIEKFVMKDTEKSDNRKEMIYYQINLYAASIPCRKLLSSSDSNHTSISFFYRKEQANSPRFGTFL